MSFLTRTTIALIFLSFFANRSAAQLSDSTMVLVRGIYKYEVRPYKMTMEFSLEENGVSCGPNSQFESINDQFAYLLDSLQNHKGITSRIKEVDDMSNFSNRNPKRTYSFESDDIEEFKILKKHAEYAFANNFSYFYHYDAPKLEDQDEFAIGAFNDAEVQIKAILKNAKGSSYKLIAIDDLTSSVLGLRSNFFLEKVGIKNGESGEVTKSYALNVYYSIKD